MFKRLWGRRGNGSSSIFAFIGVTAASALAVDLAIDRVSLAQLDSSADAAALGGASVLDGTPEGIERAKRATVELAHLNKVYGGLPVDTSKIDLGTYAEDGTFIPITGPIDKKTARKIGGVKIRERRNRTPLTIAAIAFGKPHKDNSARSTAVRPPGGTAGTTECYLPLALPDCNFPDNPTENPPPMHIVFGNNLTDNVGWAHATNANTMNIIDTFQGLCGHDEIRVGEYIHLSNGVNTPIVRRVADILNGLHPWVVPEPWPADDTHAPPMPSRESPFAFSKKDSLVRSDTWGNVIAGPIALVDMGGEPGSCEGTANFNGQRKVTGFTWGYLYDARLGNASQKGFMLQLDFLTQHTLGTEEDPEAKGNLITPPGPPKLLDD